MPRKSNFPQLGGEAESYQRQTNAGVPKLTKAGNPDMGLRFPGQIDLTNPAVVRAAVGNMVHSIGSAPARTQEFGRNWFPKVHEAVSKGIRPSGFLRHAEDKHLSGSGLVAAVSPNMDWDNANIDAFKELRGLKSSHWDAIMAAQPGKTRQALAGREQARAAVAGLSIRKAPLRNLQKAGQIIRGEHPDTVLKGPKTFNFAHNIHDPSDPRYVTIDGRAYDTMTNRLRPWDVGRGIDETSGYDPAARIVKAVSSRMGMTPSEGQATSWSHVKYNLEQAGSTQRGEPRRQGPDRIGQPYFHPDTGHPALHQGQFG